MVKASAAAATAGGRGRGECPDSVRVAGIAWISRVGISRLMLGCVFTNRAAAAAEAAGGAAAFIVLAADFCQNPTP